MSGIKYSRMRLKEAKRAALERCETARKAEEGAKVLLCELERSVRVSSSNPAAFGDIEAELRAVLEEAGRERSQAENELSSLRLDMDTARTAGERALLIAQKAQSLKKRIREANADVGVQASAAALEGRMEASGPVFELWDRDRFQELSSKGRTLAESIDRDIRDKRPAGFRASEVAELDAEIERLKASCAEKEEKQRMRLHIVECIDQVCKKLGYAVRREPPDDPNLPYKLDVNTWVYGHIVFELSLDGNLESRSMAIGPERCAATWVAEFEDRMKSLGVELTFRYVADGSPVRIDKAAKGRPAGATERKHSAAREGA